MTPSDEFEPDTGVVVADCENREQGMEQMLVLVAMGLEAELTPRDGGYALRVGVSDEAYAREQLRLYSLERTLWPGIAPHRGLSSAAVWSLLIYGWGLCLLFLLQVRSDSVWKELGASDAELVMSGDWYRSATALALHADVAHLLSNVVAGILFASFVLLRFRVVSGWSLMLASGVVGNLINAWLHVGTGHSSIGASTMVFGMLGVLVGYQIVRGIQRGTLAALRSVLLPLGGGLALLAMLGTGGEQTDILAHLCGFGTGCVLGLISEVRHGMVNRTH